MVLWEPWGTGLSYYAIMGIVFASGRGGANLSLPAPHWTWGGAREMAHSPALDGLGPRTGNGAGPPLQAPFQWTVRDPALLRCTIQGPALLQCTVQGPALLRWTVQGPSCLWWTVRGPVFI
jgi:hypothetical protein